MVESSLVGTKGTIGCRIRVPGSSWVRGLRTQDSSKGRCRRSGSVLSCTRAAERPTKKSASVAISRLKTGTTWPFLDPWPLSAIPLKVRSESPTARSRAITQPWPAFQNRWNALLTIDLVPQLDPERPAGRIVMDRPEPDDSRVPRSSCSGSGPDRRPRDLSIGRVPVQGVDQRSGGEAAHSLNGNRSDEARRGGSAEADSREERPRPRSAVPRSCGAATGSRPDR